jgi:hypothetical protein
MIAAGIKVGGLEEGEEAAPAPKKKPEQKKRPAGRRQEKVSRLSMCWAHPELSCDADLC